MNLQDYFSRKRSLEELLDSKYDDSGCIEGKVFMIWPPRNKLHRINLEVLQDAALYRFEVEVPHKDGIAFRPHEHVSLALKGMRVDQRKESSAPHYFPVVLRFPDGVVFKYLSGANAGSIVDTREERVGNTDEWYNPGMVHTVSDVATADASKIYHDSVPTKNHPSSSAPSPEDLRGCHDEGIKGDRLLASLVATSRSADTVPSVRLAQQPNTERLGHYSKVRARKRRRLHKEKMSKFSNQPNDTNGVRPADVTMLCDEQSRTSIRGSMVDTSDSNLKFRQLSGDAKSTASIREDNDNVVDLLLETENNCSNAVVPHGEAGVSVLQLKAGIRTQRGDIFTALGDLQKGHSMINVIGIVAFASPEKKTRTNEWSRSFSLVDPSTVDSPRQCITVNCFQKKYSEWLPQVRKDDIVILRKLKVVDFNGVTTATGYGDKLRWAVYDPLGHTVRPPNKGDAPEKVSNDDGMGYEFSPYWEPFQDSTELEYCRQIGEWWKAKHELEGHNISVVQCSGVRKRHLLISEASPDLPPGGFFNCTVEVVQKFNNHGGASTIYVTDYTTNPLVHTVRAAWCPPELCDRVLQCDMWDNARNIAQMMNPGEYWYLHNVRARWNPSHFMEGTMQLAEKITQLDETKLEAQPLLSALLARKKEFQLNKPSHGSGSTSLHIFPEMLLQDVEGSTSFLTCIVELLHYDLNSQDGHFIYVTDYTYNPDLPTTISTADWARGLEHRVLKIQLDDSQAKISLDLRPGSLFIIHNVRVKLSNTSGGIHGCLGGEDTLIHSLRDPSSHHAQMLQSNKEKWQRETVLDSLMTVPNESHGEGHGLLRHLHDSTLQEMLARPAPDTFRVLARAVDFFPFSLEDACALRCVKCELSPPPSFKRCPRCDDMIETHCRWFYRFYILLRDEEGSEQIVSLSGKECRLLQDVDPTDLRCDQVAFCKFLVKLGPILGNLQDVHVAWSRNEHEAIDSPLMMFTIGSWNVGEERGYSLLDCTPTQGARL